MSHHVLNLLESPLLQRLPVLAQIDPSEKTAGSCPLQRSESRQAGGKPGQKWGLGLTKRVLDEKLSDLQLCQKKCGAQCPKV